MSADDGSIGQRVAAGLARDSVTWFVVLGSSMLLFGYWLTFSLTMVGGLRQHAWSAVTNTAPAILLGVAVHLVLRRFIWRRSAHVALAAQVPLALVFATAWYLSILVGRALRSDWLAVGVDARPFMSIAFVWQMFQGVTLYAVVALASLSIDLTYRLRAAELGQDVKLPRSVPTTIMVRQGQECETVPIDDIVCIAGAGDYCEVALDNRRILSTSAIGDFEAALPADHFVRIHRSSLVRAGAIMRTEPAGNGRTVVHLTNGDARIASRSGTRLLRDCAL